MFLIYVLLKVVTGTAKGGYVMGTFKTQIIKITVNSFDGNVTYDVTFKDAFPGIRKNAAGVYEEIDVNNIIFSRKQLLRLLIDAMPIVGTIYTHFKEQSLLKGEANKFGAAHISALLKDAEIELNRTKFEAGDEYADDNGVMHQHEYAGYNTAFGDIQLSKAGEQFSNMLMNAILGI